MKLRYRGDILKFPNGITGKEIVNKLNLDDKIVGLSLNGQFHDLLTPLNLPDGEYEVEFIKIDDPRSAEFFRHTMAHIMAQAVMRIFGKDVKLGIGPTIENGFYYDFDVPGGISEEDLPKIEEEMRKIIEEDLELERFEMEKEKAMEYMKSLGQDYKVSLIKDIDAEKVSFYKQGEFVDLCRGPHVPRTGMVKHFKLLSVSGAYWRGDERNPMLYRIYGTAFYKAEDLENYLKMVEEAKRRDHRKLGPALDLFSFDSESAPGMVFIHPKGMIVMNELIKMWREIHERAGYKEVYTPLIMTESLWRQSGHWDHYRENMYFTEKENRIYAVKPMNCPGHIIIYKSRSVSYRDLPLRLAELGRVHRYERSGVLHGLLRVRSFTQDDAHIFCTEEQIEEEIRGIIRIIDEIYGMFGFPYMVELSTKPEDAMGDERTWEIATNALKKALDSIGMEYKINEGEGAFYGPKIDFHLRDSLGRMWQCATIQLDFLMPERFDLKYIGPDNREHRPVMIHRVVLGSIERFLGILVEHYAGAFPTWLAPIQVRFIPIADRHLDYCRKVMEDFRESGLRVDIDDRQRKTGYKIREAQLQKIPYMLVVGDREVESGKVAVRLRSGRDLGDMDPNVFKMKILEEIKRRMNSSIFEDEVKA